MADDDKKPWGSDEEFNAEKAWTLIQNLRKDKQDLIEQAAGERQARLTAERTLAESDPEGKIKAAEERAAKAERASHLATALRKFPALEGFEDLLSGDDEETVLKSAERLASLGKPKSDEDNDKPNADTENDDTTGLPKPALKPGHGGDDPAPFDPVAIAKAARR